MPARRFTDALEAEIANKYLSGIGTVVLAQEYSTVPNVINAVLNRQGIARRTKEGARQFTRAAVNDSLFAGPGLSEYEQYWIGFLMADGCISKVPQSKHLRINVKLHIRDIEHLRKFVAFLSAENNIFVYGDDCCVSIVSDELCANLSQWGIVPRKTLIASVHPELLYSNHFWRGYVDGDGCMSFTAKVKKLSPKLSIVCGSQVLIDQFLAYCESIVGYKTKSTKKKTSRSIGAGYASTSAVKIVKAMYSGATIYLDRKNEIANRVMEWEANGTWESWGRHI